MIEDTKLTQFCIAPLEPDWIFSAEEGEVAYALKEIFHGTCETKEEETLQSIVTVSPETLGFELDMEVDMLPFSLTTFLADKSVNVTYGYGDHAHGEKHYQEHCRFQRGDKVLCLIYEGFNAVFPAIVVESLSEEYLRRSYTEEGWDLFNPSEDELIKNWWDWNWDSVVVRPLVRIIDCCMIPMGETAIINRVYVFPYKKFDI